MVQGKNAIVTGSTSGIGEGIARSLAQAGANVMLNGFGDAGEIEALRKDLETHGIKAEYSGADMRDPEAIAGMVAQARDAFGQVDILINNAGIQHVANTEDFPPEKWQAILDINLSSAFHTIHQTVAAMKQRGWGRIINIASAHGLVASKGKAAYVAAKHGIMGLTKVVGLEVAGSGVTCNAVCPGWVLTPLVQKQIDDMAARDGISGDEARVKLLSEKQPSEQFTTVEQLGQSVLFLCSEGAANMTGTQIVADGGWTAQ